jgi:hypothetical protein
MAGSGSALGAISVVDPNPKESVGFGLFRIRKKYGFGSRHWKNKKFCEKSQTKHKNMFFLCENFSLQYRFQNTREAPFGKVSGQIISLRIRIRINKFVDPNPKKNEFGSRTLGAMHIV